LAGDGVSVAGGVRAHLATIAVKDGPTLRISFSEFGTLAISRSTATPRNFPKTHL
jgi:hypothetical protein